MGALAGDGGGSIVAPVAPSTLTFVAADRRINISSWVVGLVTLPSLPPTTPGWTLRRCSLRLSFLAKPLPHMLQRCGLGLECVVKWRSISDRCENALRHTGHPKTFVLWMLATSLCVSASAKSSSADRFSGDEVEVADEEDVAMTIPAAAASLACWYR